MKYLAWYSIFRLCLKLEAVAIWGRDRAQREKMRLVQPVPGFWENLTPW